MKVSNFFRFLTPFGLVEYRRRIMRRKRLSIPRAVSDEMADAIRIELWPCRLRDSSQPGVLVDVGANEGEFTAAALTLVDFDEAFVFEPQADCQESVQRLARDPRVQLHEEALGEENGEIELRQFSNSRFLIEMNYVPHYESGSLFHDVYDFMIKAGFRLVGVSAPYCDDKRPLWADAMFERQN